MSGRSSIAQPALQKVEGGGKHRLCACKPIFILRYRLHFSEIHTRVLNTHFIIFTRNLTFPLAPSADSALISDKCQTILLNVRQRFLDLENCEAQRGKDTKQTLSLDFSKLTISKNLTHLNPYIYINRSQTPKSG